MRLGHPLRWLRARAGARPPGRALPVLPPRQGYERWAATYEREVNPVRELEARALGELLPDLAGRLVLDVGAGTGRVSRLALARGARAAVGLDFALPMLRAAAGRPRPGASWVAGEGRRLPFRRHAFDVVVCALVLGHVAELEPVLAGIADVLRPGGTLLVSDFHPCAALRGWQRAFRDPGSGRSYAIEQHAHLLERYVSGLHALGFVLEALREPLHEGFPLVFVLRARRAGAGP